MFLISSDYLEDFFDLYSQIDIQLLISGFPDTW